MTIKGIKDLCELAEKNGNAFIQLKALIMSDFHQRKEDLGLILNNRFCGSTIYNGNWPAMNSLLEEEAKGINDLILSITTLLEDMNFKNSSAVEARFQARTNTLLNLTNKLEVRLMALGSIMGELEAWRSFNDNVELYDNIDNVLNQIHTLSGLMTAGSNLDDDKYVYC